MRTTLHVDLHSPEGQRVRDKRDPKNTEDPVLLESTIEIETEELAREISQAEAVLALRSRRAVRKQTPGPVVGRAVVRVMEAAFNFLRKP